jgi:CRISPR-associated protein Csm2
MNSYGSGRGPSRPSGSGPSGRDRAAPRGPDPQFEDLLQKADLRNPSASLFDTDAEAIAKTLSRDPNRNKSSQVRRFYDEVIRYADRHRGTDDPVADKATFARDLPLIRMICARAAYAQARQHVDANFVAFIQDGLRKVSTPEELDNFRALFEAVIGFSPKSPGG